MVSMIVWLWSWSVNVIDAPFWPFGSLVAGPAVNASGALMSLALISSWVDSTIGALEGAPDPGVGVDDFGSLLQPVTDIPASVVTTAAVAITVRGILICTVLLTLGNGNGIPRARGLPSVSWFKKRQ